MCTKWCVCSISQLDNYNASKCQIIPKKTKNSCKYCVFIKNKLNMTKRVEIEALAYRAASDF